MMDCDFEGLLHHRLQGRQKRKIWIQIPFCLNCDLDFAGLLVPSFARTCIFVFVAEFCIFLNLCFPPDICAFFGIYVFLVLPLMDCDLDCAGCSSFSERWREKQGEEAILVAITLFVALVLISDVIC